MFKGRWIKIACVILVVSLFSIGCVKKETKVKPVKDAMTIKKEQEMKTVSKALASFKVVLDSYPDKIGFHKTLKHWNFKMPTGELFEWTKDVGENKADYAMVLLAEPFIKAGFDKEKLKGDNWIFKAAEIEDGVELPDRLIHPFNIADKSENSNGWEDALRRAFRKMPSVVSYDDKSKITLLTLGEGFLVKLKENSDPKKSVFTFKINLTDLALAGLDVSKLDPTQWVQDGKGGLVRIYSLE